MKVIRGVPEHICDITLSTSKCYRLLGFHESVNEERTGCQTKQEKQSLRPTRSRQLRVSAFVNRDAADCHDKEYTITSTVQGPEGHAKDF